MSDEKPALQVQESQLTDKKVLAQILKLQLQLSSKMFEFMREYQKDVGFSSDDRVISNNKRLSRLLGEVNELGVALGGIASAFVGEDVYEKRDDQGRLILPCNVCKKETPFVGVADFAHGIPGAYMSDSERLVCSVCREDAIYPNDERLPKFNSVFEIE